MTCNGARWNVMKSYYNWCWGMVLQICIVGRRGQNYFGMRNYVAGSKSPPKKNLDVQ